MNGGGKVVCVTGATGYIASWIVKLLPLRGYTVKATVRDPNDTKKTKHLLALEGADERLRLFKADLLEEGSFQQAIEGCDGVFHIASPVIFTATDPQVFQAELIDPAVKGTMNVLKTCAKASSVKRVIVTSSTAAVLGCKPPLGPNDVVDETFFSDPNFCLEMQPTLNFSIEVIVDLLNGKSPPNSFYYRFVDVRDVSLAHIKAFEVPSASGRYIIVDPNTTIKDIKKNEESDEMMNEMTYKVCVEKVKSLGIEFTPIKETLGDTIISLKEKCLYKPTEDPNH
ncbi:NAD-dependent epimerase/dehydratase, partial [Arabidopsis suecica]